MRRQRIKYVSEYRDRHGKWRAKFRKVRFGTYHFKNPVGSEEFWQEYRLCEQGIRPGTDPDKKYVPQDRTMNSLAQMYFTSPDFTKLRHSTKTVYRRMIQAFLDDYGASKVTAWTPRHVYQVMTQMADTPSQANNLKKRLRTLFHLAIFLGWRETDPIVGVKNIQYESQGFHTWTEDEIAAFEDFHPVGSKARLAFTILLYTGLRRSDLVRVGWQHVKGERLVIRAVKNRNIVNVPLHPVLKDALAHLPKDQMQFVLTEYDKPFSAKGFGNRMAKWCADAGVPGCSSHGLRKAIACRLFEAGASLEEVGAVLGDKDLKVIRRYVEEANLGKLTDAGFARLKSPPEDA